MPFQRVHVPVEGVPEIPHARGLWGHVSQRVIRGRFFRKRYLNGGYLVSPLIRRAPLIEKNSTLKTSTLERRLPPQGPDSSLIEEQFRTNRALDLPKLANAEGLDVITSPGSP